VFLRAWQFVSVDKFMNVPISFSGSLCVGDTGLLFACCARGLDIEWFVEFGVPGINGIDIKPLDNDPRYAVLSVNYEGGFKIRAECCEDIPPGYNGGANFDPFGDPPAPSGGGIQG